MNYFQIIIRSRFTLALGIQSVRQYCLYSPTIISYIADAKLFLRFILFLGTCFSLNFTETPVQVHLLKGNPLDTSLQMLVISSSLHGHATLEKLDSSLQLYIIYRYQIWTVDWPHGGESIRQSSTCSWHHHYVITWLTNLDISSYGYNYSNRIWAAGTSLIKESFGCFCWRRDY